MAFRLFPSEGLPLAGRERDAGVHPPGRRGAAFQEQGLGRAEPRADLLRPRLPARPGTNFIKIGLPGKLILSLGESPILLRIVSKNRFSGKTYLYTIGSR